MKRTKIIALLLGVLMILSAVGCGTPSKEQLEKGNVIAAASSKAEAKEIARLYDMELINWSGHVALYYSERDIAELQRIGEENGWPLVEKNETSSIS